MMDSRAISRLHQWASGQGAVQSVVPLLRDNRHAGMVMLTMHSPEIAHQMHRQFGFIMYGHSALIVSDHWLAEHLPEE